MILVFKIIDCQYYFKISLILNMPTTCISPTANKEDEHVTFHRFPSVISLREKWIKKYLARIGNGIYIIDYVVGIFLLMTIKPRAWIQALEGE